MFTITGYGSYTLPYLVKY